MRGTVAGQAQVACVHLAARRHHLLPATGQPEAAPVAAGMVSICLGDAKNNQYGREVQRFQHAATDDVFCPVRAARLIVLAAWALGTRRDAPALSCGAAGGLRHRDLSTWIKAAATAHHMDARRFSMHSIRIGGATKLVNTGADRLLIHLLGRWHSSVFEDYPVLTAEGTQGLSHLMVTPATITAPLSCATPRQTNLPAVTAHSTTAPTRRSLHASTAAPPRHDTATTTPRHLTTAAAAQQHAPPAQRYCALK